MIYPVYSIRDLKGEFMTPWIQSNDGTAKRQFAMAVNNGDSPIGFAPKDFELYHIAEFDGSTGVITGLGIPEFIIRGDDLVGI